LVEGKGGKGVLHLLSVTENGALLHGRKERLRSAEEEKGKEHLTSQLRKGEDERKGNN